MKLLLLPDPIRKQGRGIGGRGEGAWNERFPSVPHPPSPAFPDFQRSLCRQAQKQVPEGTVEIWAFRGKEGTEIPV